MKWVPGMLTDVPGWCKSLGLPIVRPNHVELFWGNVKIYLHFLSFLNNEMPLIPYGRQGPVYPKRLKTWLMMTWQPKETGHQQPWYRIDLVFPEYFGLCMLLFTDFDTAVQFRHDEFSPTLNRHPIGSVKTKVWGVIGHGLGQGM